MLYLDFLNGIVLHISVCKIQREKEKREKTLYED